jgi:hypothetical protein
MVGIFRPPQTLAFVFITLTLAFTALVASAPIASGSHDDCTLSSTAPSSYLRPAVILSGSVDCATTKSVVRFSIVLTRDGNVATTSERTCHKAATCWSYVFDNDPVGDQRYCSIVSARVGSHSLEPVSRCEAEASP